MGMPITANIIHTMKQTVNAVVLAVTTDHCLNCCDAIVRSLRDLARTYRHATADTIQLSADGSTANDRVPGLRLVISN
jgi:hypothetical protein